MFFNNNENKFFSVAYGLQNNLTIENLDKYRVFFVITAKKTSFNSVLTALFLLYRPNRKFTTDFYECLQYLVDFKSLDIIAGDFNIHGFLKEGLQDAVTGYSHIGGSLLNHVYVDDTIMEEFDVHIQY